MMIDSDCFYWIEQLDFGVWYSLWWNHYTCCLPVGSRRMLHKACSQSDSDHYQANQLVFCLAWLASSSSTVQPRQVNKKISSHRKLWSCYSPIMTHQSLQYILLVYKEAENSKLYTRGGNCLFKPCDENALSYGLVIIWGWGLIISGIVVKFRLQCWFTG